MANVVSSRLNNRFETFTYTFAAPATTVVSDSIAKSYGSIFNVINTEDLVTLLPLHDWGFRRYGIDKSASINDSYKTQWEALSGEEYACNIKDLNIVLSEFNALEKNRNGIRESVYKYKCSCHGDGSNKNITYSTNFPTISEYGQNYYKKVQVNLDGITTKCETTAFFMQFLAKLAAESNIPTALTDVAPAYESVKWKFTVFAYYYMEDPHLQHTYYLLSSRVG